MPKAFTVTMRGYLCKDHQGGLIAANVLSRILEAMARGGPGGWSFADIVYQLQVPIRLDGERALVVMVPKGGFQKKASLSSPRGC